MPKVSLVATLGMAPPVVTEFLEYMIKAENLRVTDLTVVSTNEPVVLEGLKLVQAAVEVRYPQVHFHEEVLPLNDTTTVEETFRFMEILGRVLIAQRKVHRVDSVHLSLAGGRKDMSVTGALMAQYFGVDSVCHIIVPDIKLVNAQLEALRKLISDLARADDRIKFYLAHSDILNNLMYPPLGSYRVIKIPVIPYPRDTLEEIYRMLGRRKCRVSDLRLPREVLERLHHSGFIRITSKDTIYAEELGLKMYELLRKTLESDH